jgi:hypothetical protein
MSRRSEGIKGKELDTNVSILHSLMQPGQCLSTRAIADIVGCSNTLIFLIEKQALRKVRERLRRRLGASYGEFCQEKVSSFL